MSTFNSRFSNLDVYCFDSLASFSNTDNIKAHRPKIKASTNPYGSVLNDEISPKNSLDFSVLKSIDCVPNSEITNCSLSNALYPHAHFPIPSKNGLDHGCSIQTSLCEQGKDLHSVSSCVSGGVPHENILSSLYFDPLADEKGEENKMLEILCHEMNSESPLVSGFFKVLSEQNQMIEKSVKWSDYVFYYIFGTDRTGYFEIQEKIKQVQQSPWCVFDKDFWDNCVKDTGSASSSLASPITNFIKSDGTPLHDSKSRCNNNQSSSDKTIAQSIDIVSVDSCSSGDFCCRVFEHV